MLKFKLSFGTIQFRFMRERMSLSFEYPGKSRHPLLLRPHNTPEKTEYHNYSLVYWHILRLPVSLSYIPKILKLSSTVQILDWKASGNTM